jgi:hypothetical protein
MKNRRGNAKSGIGNARSGVERRNRTGGVALAAGGGMNPIVERRGLGFA